MAKQIDVVETLKEYLVGVTNRADHHGGNVFDVISHLVRVVIICHDKDSIECRTYSGKTTNILKFSINGQKYAFRYEHSNGGFIELREDNERGKVLDRFTNANSLQDVITSFKNFCNCTNLP